MASRFLHYLVGDRVAKKLEIEDYERFMTGNLYPDCVRGPGGRKGKKGKSHFADNTPEGKWTAPEIFRKKYAAHIPEDMLYIGYICHLITDLVWHDEVYIKLKETYHVEDFSILSKPLYRDYHRLNEIMRKEYELNYQPLKKLDCEIEEIELDLWENFSRELEEDFKESTGAKKEDLEVLSYEWIGRFIELSVCKCETMLKAIMQ
ncbi:MAG: zinc dependent phospholipase C family protein [Lachnospiraceae bacterium]|nr:zinc dependent phospholipase C family protein [Lachnospiraceae bacterium]